MHGVDFNGLYALILIIEKKVLIKIHRQNLRYKTNEQRMKKKERKQNIDS